jgi:hypothetical protein
MSQTVVITGHILDIHLASAILADKLKRERVFPHESVQGAPFALPVVLVYFLADFYAAFGYAFFTQIFDVKHSFLRSHASSFPAAVSNKTGDPRSGPQRSCSSPSPA